MGTTPVTLPLVLSTLTGIVVWIVLAFIASYVAFVALSVLWAEHGLGLQSYVHTKGAADDRIETLARRGLEVKQIDLYLKAIPRVAVSVKWTRKIR